MSFQKSLAFWTKKKVFCSRKKKQAQKSAAGISVRDFDNKKQCLDKHRIIILGTDQAWKAKKQKNM